MLYWNNFGRQIIFPKTVEVISQKTQAFPFHEVIRHRNNLKNVEIKRDASSPWLFHPNFASAVQGRRPSGRLTPPYQLTYKGFQSNQKLTWNIVILSPSVLMTCLSLQCLNNSRLQSAPNFPTDWMIRLNIQIASFENLIWFLPESDVR